MCVLLVQCCELQKIADLSILRNTCSVARMCHKFCRGYLNTECSTEHKTSSWNLDTRSCLHSDRRRHLHTRSCLHSDRRRHLLLSTRCHVSATLCAAQRTIVAAQRPMTAPALQCLIPPVKQLCIITCHVFNIHGSVHRESNLITVHQDVTYSVYYISVGSSTCFGC